MAPTSQMDAGDVTHISVVAVDDKAEKEALLKREKEGSPEEENVSSVIVEPKSTTPVKPAVHNEVDHQGHLETSSNISNMSNLSGGTASTGRSISSAEEENRPAMSLVIEGTTVEATDVDDDDVFHHTDQQNSKVLHQLLCIWIDICDNLNSSVINTVYTHTHTVYVEDKDGCLIS